MTLKIGTRGSTLALIQAEEVRATLANSGIDAEIHSFTTSGDRNTSSPIYAMGKIGVFVEELNREVERGAFDIAVHSAKDIPSRISDALEVSAVLKRASFNDVLVSHKPLDNLPEGSVIGTSSMRRISELKSLRPDLAVKDIRGNIDTRLEKFRGGKYDGIILAKAALERMGEDTNYYTLSEDDFLPAPNQGIIAMVSRKGSRESELLRNINHDESYRSFVFERKLVSSLGLGCSVPAGILCQPGDESSVLRARFYSITTNEHREYVSEVKGIEDVSLMAEHIRGSLPASYGYGFGV